MHPSAERRAGVEPLELFGERADGLLLKNRHDAFETHVLARMEVDGVSTGSERRVSKPFEVLLHVRDDRVGDVASLAARRRRRGIGRVRDHGSG